MSEWMNDGILERNEVRASFYLRIFLPFSSIASIILSQPSRHESTHSPSISLVFSSFVNLYLFPLISPQSIAPGVFARMMARFSSMVFSLFQRASSLVNF